MIFWLILACMLEIQLSLCWLAKNLTGMSGGSHLFEALQVLFIAVFIHWCRTSCNNVAPVTNLCLLASKRALRVLLLELVYDL